MGGIDGCILLLNVLLLTRIFTTCRIKYVLSFQSLPLNTELPRNLQQTKFVFIRRDAHKTPLRRPYEGQFKVITPGTKTFTVGCWWEEYDSVSRQAQGGLYKSRRTRPTSWTKETWKTTEDTIRPVGQAHNWPSPSSYKTQKHKFRTGSESTTTVQIMIGSRGSGVAETEYEPHNLVVIN